MEEQNFLEKQEVSSDYKYLQELDVDVLLEEAFLGVRTFAQRDELRENLVTMLSMETDASIEDIKKKLKSDIDNPFYDMSMWSMVKERLLIPFIIARSQETEADEGEDVNATDGDDEEEDDNDNHEEDGFVEDDGAIQYVPMTVAYIEKHKKRINFEILNDDPETRKGMKTLAKYRAVYESEGVPFPFLWWRFMEYYPYYTPYMRGKRDNPSMQTQLDEYEKYAKDLREKSYYNDMLQLFKDNRLGRGEDDILKDKKYNFGEPNAPLPKRARVKSRFRAASLRTPASVHTCTS
jgi:hypothetical protein